jgi:hypothetical protein
LLPEAELNFLEPAEMYTGRQSAEGKAQPYRRFGSLALAVKFAIEQQPSALHCTTIESDDIRLQNKEIQAAYDSADFRAAIEKVG